MAEDEVDFTKLSLEERASHKNFKARVSAYEELIKIFSRIDDERSPEWGKYSPIIRGVPNDSHAAAQEKGLEAMLIFIQNAHQAGNLASHLMSGIIAKCLSSTRARIKELSNSVTLMLIEIERFETVQDELMKGMELKNPKVVAACISLCFQALREFGIKVIKLKPLIKKLPVLLEDRDKGVRDEAKKLTVEILRWVPIKQEFSTLKPVLIAEIDAELAKFGTTKPVQTRYLKSQQEKRERQHAEGEVEAGGGEFLEEVAAEIDPYELIPPEEILSKLPKDFYEKLDAKKWQDRKEALEALDALTTRYPKLEPGDYGDLVRILKRVIGKDNNVVVTALAAKCSAGLANGLKKKFSPYAPSVISVIFEKFKEKKANVLNALKEAADSCFPCTSLETIAEDCISALQNKNPAVKTETALFLVRSFAKTPNKTMVDKKLIKPFIVALLNNLNEPDPGVRDAAAEALGSIHKAMGEKMIAPFLADTEALKLEKIKECAKKAIVLAPKATPKAAPAPAKAAPPKFSPTDESEPVPVKRPIIKKPAAAVKKPSVKIEKRGSEQDLTTRPSNGSTTQLTPEELANRPLDLSTQFDDQMIAKLNNKDWRAREEALDKLSSMVKAAKTIQPYLGCDFVNSLNNRLQDSNRSIQMNSFIVLQNMAPRLGVNCKQNLRSFLPTMLCGLGEKTVPLRACVTACLNAWAESLSVEDFFQGEMIAEALKQPSPTLRTELFNWLAPRLLLMKSVNKEDLAAAMPALFSCIEDRNVDVRKAANDCILGFLYHLGYDKMNYQAARLKPSSKACVVAALDKARPNLPEKLPGPTRSRSTPYGGGPMKAKPLPKGPTLSGSGNGASSKVGPSRFGESSELSNAGKGRSPAHGSEGSEYQEEMYQNSRNTPSPQYGRRERQSERQVDGSSSTPEFVVQAPARRPKPNETENNSSGTSKSNWALPTEYQIDFDAIESKYPKKGPLQLVKPEPIDYDFLTPVVIPKIKSNYGSSNDESGLPDRASQNIDMVIAQISNSSIRRSTEALLQLQTIISDPSTVRVFYRRMDHMLQCISVQIRKVETLLGTSNAEKLQEIEQLLRAIAYVLQSCYKDEDLPKYATMDAIKDTIHLCLALMSDPAIDSLKEPLIIIKYFNVLVVKIIERSDLNHAFKASMRLMTDSLKLPHYNRIQDLTMKVQWKALKQLSLQLEKKEDYELDIEGFLDEFCIFMKAHPFNSWKNRDDQPLRSMKTLVHHLITKIGARKVQLIISGIPSYQKETEGSSYVRKVVEKQLAKSGNSDRVFETEFKGVQSNEIRKGILQEKGNSLY